MNPISYLVRAEIPQFIQVADKPLRLGGKIERISVDEFQRRFKCIYNDGVSVEPGTKIPPFEEDIFGKPTSNELKAQVKKILRTAHESLVLCDMGKEGHGVFASTDIPKFTVVAIYAGTINTRPKHANEEEALGFEGTDISIGGRHHRGISSFMQQLPGKPKKWKDAKEEQAVLMSHGHYKSETQIKLDNTFYHTEFDANNQEHIAVSNIRREYLNIGGVPVVVLMTDTDVKAGDQLGFDYGGSYGGYWKARKITPEFFYKSGAVVPHALYKRTFGRLNFDGFSYTGEYKPLIDLVRSGQKTIKLICDDKKRHELSAAMLMCSLLSVNACALQVFDMAKLLLLQTLGIIKGLSDEVKTQPVLVEEGK